MMILLLAAIVVVVGTLFVASSSSRPVSLVQPRANRTRIQLGSYVVNPDLVFVSGLSSGAYMATQLGIAFSSLFKGHGSLAGGPFYCAENNVNIALSACMATPQMINVNTLLAAARDYEESGDIDSLSNLGNHRNFIFHGQNDGTVQEGCSVAHEEFMQNFVDDADVYIQTSYNTETGHAHPTDDYGNPCTSTRSPWVNDCDYDATGIMLRYLYGDVEIKNRVQQIDENLFEFDQTGSFWAASMDPIGYVYVPTACQAGSTCSLHVALHGCQQYHSSPSIGTTYVTQTSYNDYAEANNIIVLYPQTIEAFAPYNPNGCWDWWGYGSSLYSTKRGPQMDAIYNMVKQLMSGAPPLDTPAAPSILAVGDDFVSLSWSPVDSATTYDVLRDGVRVNPSRLSTFAYNDTGLSSGTQYYYSIVAHNNEGGSSSPSPSTPAKTTGNPPPLTAPTGVTVTSTTSSTVSLRWAAVSGAIFYGINRDGLYVGNVTTTTFTDTSLQAETSYDYTVFASDATGAWGPESAVVTATTSSSWQCEEYYDSNYDHERAGRAYQQAGLCYAVGSNDYMGLWNVGAMTTLGETSQGYFEVGGC